MEIKTLNQLKKVVRREMKLVITAHRQPGYVGKRWYVNDIQTGGFSCAADGVAERLMTGTNGWGSNLVQWRRAAFWSFENGVCKVFDSAKEHTKRHLLMAFRIIEEEAS